MAAYKRPKTERAPFVEEALHGATEVPLQTLERASAMLARMEALQIPARYASDLMVAQGPGSRGENWRLRKCPH